MNKYIIFIILILSMNTVSGYQAFTQDIELNYVVNNNSVVVWTNGDSKKISFNEDGGSLELETDVRYNTASCPAITDDTNIKIFLESYTNTVKSTILDNCDVDQAKLSKELSSNFETCNRLIDDNTELKTKNGQLEGSCGKIDVLERELENQIKDKDTKNNIIIALFVLVVFLVISIIVLMLIRRD